MARAWRYGFGVNDSASSRTAALSPIGSSAPNSPAPGETSNGGSGTAPQPALDALQMVSVNHRTAPIEVLERVALSPDQAHGLLSRLRDAGIEAVVLATCNRTELYWRNGRDGDAHLVSRGMTQTWTEPLPEFHRYSVSLHGTGAVRHLFRVAAGLESLMQGEAEILGQLRAAFERADTVRSAGPMLSDLFRAAIKFGRRARAATAIGSGAMSVASASVHALKRTHPDLSSTSVVVIGAGHTGFKAAQHLRAEGVGRLVLVNRTLERAREAAARLNAECAPLESLGVQMATADAVVAAVQAPEPVVDAAMVRQATEGRNRPLTIVDLSLPRAVAPDVDRIPGVTVADLSRLEEVVLRSREKREREIPRVEALLEPAIEELGRQSAETAARPLVAELRVRAEEIRRAEVERAVAAGLGDAAALDHVTRRVVDRLLRAPSEALRNGIYESNASRDSCLRCVFGVGDRSADAD
jgi:glutamyl-tRNA reductase